MFIKILRFLVKYWYLTLITGISISCYLSVLIPPHKFWPAVLTSYAIPILLILNILLLIVIVVNKRKLVVFPLICLIFGTPFFLITISYNRDSTSGYDLSILSFNTRYFRKPLGYDEFSPEMIQWVVKDSSKIKCIQEFCTNSNYPVVDVSSRMKNEGYNEFVYTIKNQYSENRSGLAIFTKYEILDSGFVWKELYNINSALFVDLKIKEDTIRIYNVHLASMGINVDEYKNPHRYESKVRSLISKLKIGAEMRANQIYTLLNHTSNCPYPFIICGDFNDTPYSYNYFKLKRYFFNAFEKAGNGFGFSLNSILFFLRIDHHFYSTGIEAVHFRVDRSMKISDHFPTRGMYRITK